MPRHPTGSSGGRVFGVRLVAAVAVLAVIAALAAVVGSTQGPRLSSVVYSGSDLVAQSGQRVILYANQAVDAVAPGDVTVSPAAAHTVSTSGDAIAVQFTSALDYVRQYTITVRGVRAPGQAVPSTLVAHVTTGATGILYLSPGTAGAPDRIIARPLLGSTNTVEYEATGIVGFVKLGRFLVVQREGAGGTSALDIVTPGGSQVEQVNLPAAVGQVTGLHAADDASSFGFLFRSTPTGPAGLYVVSLVGTHTPLPLLASGKVATRSDATPATVTSWSYRPGGGTLLARFASGRLVLADPSALQAPRDLGAVATIEALDPTGSTALVGGTDGGSQLVDLTTGRRSAAPEHSSSSTPVALPDRASTVRIEGDRFVRTTAASRTTLPVTLPTSPVVSALCPSPNGQLVAVVVRGVDGTTVLIVDASSGALDGSVAGTTLDWCGSVPS